MTKSGQGGAVGIRNKNPLNIEYNERNNWKGQTGRNGRFCTFSIISGAFVLVLGC
ncbi:hypothetical protein [Photobacterium swingsii]|uniref:hypothetical protein n=1 Tax=Photobacterium swingsii TaxID=680026 RepID=UPI000B2B5951|nr:hypothetical protein [Photobacterium swingsii]